MGSLRFMSLTFASAGESQRTTVFLVYLFLSLMAELFIGNAFKFVAFELSHSRSVVSLVGSFSALAFISLGLFSGIVVDAYSRRFFAVFHLLAFTAISVVFYLLYEVGIVSVYLLFAFILLHEFSSALHKAANNIIFFDLCGTRNLTRWISRRSITFTAASMAASLILSIFVSSNSFLFVIYAVLLMAAFLIFRTIGYTDQNQRQSFSGIGEALVFFRGRFRAFLYICREREALLFLFVFSFLKTFFIFWPMASGALFKFGIEDDASRRLYLIAIIIMDVVSMTTLYALGWKKSYSNRSFVAGAGISGLGIMLFAIVEGTFLNIVTLSIMYVGLAVSQVSSGYVLRMELPQAHRAQGLSFSVVPYYLADIISGITFALLLMVFGVETLLFGAGAGIFLFSVLAIPYVNKLAVTARRQSDSEG